MQEQINIPFEFKTHRLMLEKLNSQLSFLESKVNQINSCHCHEKIETSCKEVIKTENNLLDRIAAIEQ